MIYGKRVELAEVESRLYRCKDVQQAIVRAFTDEDGLSYMTAYVVPSDNKLKVSEVKKNCLKSDFLYDPRVLCEDEADSFECQR